MISLTWLTVWIPVGLQTLWRNARWTCMPVVGKEPTFQCLECYRSTEIMITSHQMLSQTQKKAPYKALIRQETYLSLFTNMKVKGKLVCFFFKLLIDCIKQIILASFHDWHILLMNSMHIHFNWTWGQFPFDNHNAL